jgi:hypothetical protein
MKEMTDEEAEYWDDYYTKNPPKVDPAKNGGFAKKPSAWLLSTRFQKTTS